MNSSLDHVAAFSKFALRAFASLRVLISPFASEIKNILKDVDCENLSVKMQSIFGKRGYSIGHYAKVKRADLLIMNAPTKLGLLDRIFPHDLEYILSELPTDVLIVK